MTTSSLSTALATIVRKEGIRNLYRGLVPNLLKCAPSQAVSFGSFELTRDLIDRFTATPEDEDVDSYSS